MADPNIRIKRSSVAGKRPEISQVDMGELALNTNDGRLFTRKENVGIGSTVTLLTPWTENIGGGVYYNEGNVGLGTTNPTAKLEINGDVSIASTVSIGTTIDIVPYNDLGSLSFEGSAGQLFSITNNLTSGSIFSVNDVSGIPSIDVNADGTIQLAPYGSTEYVGIGLTNPTAKLDVDGDVNVSGVVTASTGTLISGVEIKNDGVSIGTTITTLDFTGTGISTATSSVGIATINILADISPVMMGMIF